MRKQENLFKLINVVTIILFYYITKNSSIFPYVLSFSLYNIFSASFSNFTFFEKMDDYSKRKHLKVLTLFISIIGLLFLLLSILISDISSSILNTNEMFLTFAFMGISTICNPIVNTLVSYLKSTKRINKSNIIYNIYRYLEIFLFLLISVIVFRMLDLSSDISCALLYMSKIISAAIVIFITLPTIKKDRKKISTNSMYKYNYKLELRKILTKSNSKSIINIVQNSYYYISIIIVYFVLSTRYNYAINIIENNIVFIYFYLIIMMNYIIEIINHIKEKNIKTKNITNDIYLTLKLILPFAIINSIISPLICKIIFNAPENSIYLTMISFMSIFVILYNTTANNIKTKKILHISLFIGLICKIITTVPLINAFYRMGYNLIYGDISSTILSMLITIIINYMASNNKSLIKDKYLDKILNTLYENIILAIILIVLEFIIPIDTTSYIKSLLLIIPYILVSISFFRIKYRVEKR